MLIHGNSPRTEKSETSQAARAGERAAGPQHMDADSYRDGDFPLTFRAVLVGEAIHER